MLLTNAMEEWAMRRRIFSAVITLFAAMLVGPALAQSLAAAAGSNPIRVPAASSDQIQAKAVILEKRRRGTLMDFELRVEFDGVPKGKNYQFYIYDSGMRRAGLPPAAVPNATYRFTPDSTGHLEFRFVLDGFSKGEWVQCTLRSSDRSVQKTIRFTPFK